MTPHRDTDSQLESPVALFIFRRPEYTERVLDAIIRARPTKLLVVADGPRADHPDDRELCEQTRALIDRVGGNCEVITHFAPENLGLKRRMMSGMDWVFSQVDRAILLEDDCLPDPSFFRFCEEMLTRYAHDDRIMMISGNNFLLGANRPEFSYYFSDYTHIWGWATWRRAWEKYDPDMLNWPRARADRWLDRKFDDPKVVRHWNNIFDGTYGGYINTWDYQWTFACLFHDGLSVVAEHHLVSNLGFGKTATNAFDSSDPHLRASVTPLRFPLKHPEKIVRDRQADEIEFRNLFGRNFGWRRLKYLVPWKVRASVRELVRQ